MNGRDVDLQEGTDPRIEDRRARQREGCMIRARIEAPGCTPFDCTIWDMSMDGARIVVGDNDVPDHLDVKSRSSA